MVSPERAKYESTERRNARETISERATRERAEREKAEVAAKALGGLSGNAAKALINRKSRLDKALEDAGV